MSDAPLHPSVDTCTSCKHEHMCHRFDVGFDGDHIHLCDACAKGDPCPRQSESPSTSS